MYHDVLLIQSADPLVYADMLAETSRANRAFAARHGFGYQAFVGLRRGYFAWHACFNRILMLRDLMLCGFEGWVFYLDADAYVYDPSFDLRGLLARAGDAAMVMSPGADTGLAWDVNDGVFLIRLGHPLAREIVELWFHNFMWTTDEELRHAAEWESVPSDQPRLQRILGEHPHLARSLYMVERETLNHYTSSFVRQVLRGHGLSMETRLAMIRRDLGACLQETTR